MMEQSARVVLMLLVLIFIEASQAKEKYRVCFPDKPSGKKFTKYCPLLDKPGSKAACVLGQSRLDCLRKILKGKADFGVFEAEDVAMAANYKNTEENFQILVTNELRYLKTPFEYEVLPVVRKSANITRQSELSGKKFCHPGYGLEADWTQVMSKFFEARVVPQMCEPDLSVVENHLKSSSEFFKAACKAGPWVQDQQMDAKLKQTYSNLCKLCDNPSACSMQDKYWGQVGPLYCLTDGAGDIAWARLGDIQVHFGLNSKETARAIPQDYSFLCEDDRLSPLDQPENCAWLARPWKAVLTKREAAVHVQKLLMRIKDAERLSWQWALEEILEVHSQTIVPLDAMVPPEDYLQKAPGFLSAITLSHCEPDGKIRICTRSSIEMLKCDWLRRVAEVYGVEPQLSCLEAESIEECMRAVQSNMADVVTIQPDDMATAYRDFGLKPVLYEYVKNLPLVHRVGAVVRKDSNINHIRDLKGKKACFPVYDGVGWNSILSALRNANVISSNCNSAQVLGDFFSDSCVPFLYKSISHPSNLRALCDGDLYVGELGALRCLASGTGDVAFIQLETLRNNTDGNGTEPWTADLKSRDFKSLCLDGQTGDCFISWAAPGQVLVSSEVSPVKERNIYIALLELGNLFGKSRKSQSAEFQMFAPFDRHSNILFQDVTNHLEDNSTFEQDSAVAHNYERMFESLSECSSALSLLSSTAMTVISLLLTFMISF